MTLLRAVEHPDGAGDNSVLLDANVLLLVATGTDGDGDVASAQLDVRDLLSVVDDVPALVGGAEVIATVHEDALAGANVDTVNPVAVVSGTLAATADFPADGGQFVFLGEPALTTAFDALGLTVDGQPLTFDLVGTTLTASDAASQPVFTLQVNTDGSYSFTLLANLDHPQVTADAMLPIDFGALLLAIDGDGDRVSLSQAFVVQVMDDTPDVQLTGAAVSQISVNEANFNSPQSVSMAGSFNLLQGADGATLSYSLQINNANSGLIDSLNGAQVLLTNNAGVIEGRANGELVFTFSVAANGTLTMNLLRAVEHADANGTNTISLNANSVLLLATALDGDGDTDSAQIDVRNLVAIVDDVPVFTGGLISATVHEDVLAGGNAEGGQVTVISGSLNTLADLGADGAGDFAYTSNVATYLNSLNLTSGSVALTYSVNGDILTASAGATTVFTLELNEGGVAGNYQFSLINALDHPLGNGDDSEQLVIDFGQVINAMDGDNDPVNLSGGFTVAIQDDVPIVTLNTESAVIYENTIAVGDPAIVTGNIADLVSYGGDGAGFFMMRPQGQLGTLPAVTVNDVAVTYQVNGNILSAMIGATTLFTLEIEADGDYLFTLNEAIDHPNGIDWLALDFSGAIRAVDRDGDPVNLGANQFIVNVADNPVFNPNAGDELYLTTSIGGVVSLDGYYGLSLLDPIEGDIPGLISALIGPGGVLEGGTTEQALDLILAQEGVFFSEDILKLSSAGYEMAFNGSENLSFETNLLNQLSLLGMSIDAIHVMGNQIIFSTIGGGVLPGVGGFENQDLVLATQNADGRYTFSMFFDGSAQGLQDGLLNDGVFTNLLVNFNMDDASFSSSDGTFDNGTLYFSLSNLVDVDLAYALLTLDVLGGITANGEDVLSINRVNGAWDIGSLDVFFRGADIGLEDQLLGNALQALNNVNLAGLIAALLDPDTDVIDIDGLHVDGDTLYFSLQPILNVDLLFGSLGEILANPFDPLSALTFRGEDIFSVSKNPLTGQWDARTLNLYFNGSQYNLASNDGLLGGLLDNLPENLNSFSISQGVQLHDTIMFSTSGGGNERQVGGTYDNQTLIQYNNGSFHEAFDLATVTNNTITNRDIRAVHVLENGALLFSLGSASLLPGAIQADTNDIIQWDGSNFSVYFNGSAHGLTSDMAINSVYVYPASSVNAGQMIVTFKDSGTLTGAGAFENEDLLQFNPTTDTWSSLLDGSTAGINDVSIDVAVQADLSADVAASVNALFAPLLAELDQRVDDLLGTINSDLESLDVMLAQLQSLNLLGGLLNVVNGLVGTLDGLLGTNLDGLVDGLSTQLGVDALIADLTTLIDELTPIPLDLILQTTLVNNIKALSNTIITELQALDVSAVSDLNDAIDTVDAGIAALISQLEDAVSAGSTLQFKLLDVSVDGVHLMDNGDYLLSFSQELRLDLNLSVNTSFLSGLAALGLTVDTNGLINDVDHVLDPIIAPLLGTIQLSSVLSPDLDLIGMNIYQLHYDSGSSTWQFSLYFDGKDHGLDNGTAADTVLDYVDGINSNLTLLDLQNQGLLQLSTDENLNDFNIIQQSSGTINGSSVGDLLIGDNANNTIYGGLGNDLMIGNDGANIYVFDPASIKPSAPELDSIADFNMEKGDKLYLEDIFNNYSGNPSTLQSYINVSVFNSDNVGGANDTLLALKSDPAGAVVHNIVLLNYVVAGTTSTEMLQHLIDGGGVQVTS